jgi:hypothetical protein
VTTPLVRQLAYVAADLEARTYPYVGVLRRAARALLEVDPPDDDGCRGCGRPLDQPATGRRRVWCREACRSRNRRR